MDVFKDYNSNRHYMTKHAEKYNNLSDDEGVGSKDFTHPEMLLLRRVMLYHTKSSETVHHFLMESVLKSCWFGPLTQVSHVAPELPTPVFMGGWVRG